MSETAVDRAYNWLRERILDGTFVGGCFVDEATVCEATGVSRTPAREAFNRLEGERYLTRIPRKGAQVRSVSSSDMFDAYHARFMIESFAAKEFCAAKLAVPSEMHENLQKMNGFVDFSDIGMTVKYVEADKRFHAALVRTLNNRAVEQFLDVLWKQNSLAANSRGKLLRSDAWLARNRAQHGALVDALANHNEAAAVAVLKDHLKLPYSEVLSSSP